MKKKMCIFQVPDDGSGYNQYEVNRLVLENLRLGGINFRKVSGAWLAGNGEIDKDAMLECRVVVENPEMAKVLKDAVDRLNKELFRENCIFWVEYAVEMELLWID